MSHALTSAVTHGIHAYPITIEVHIAFGLPKFTIVGLPDTAVQESRERVKAAIENSGFSFPDTKVLANLAPADIKKEGPSYDLPIAIALLAECGILFIKELLEQSIFFGELGLDGSVRAVSGSLPVALLAKKEGFRRLYLPAPNAGEAALIHHTYPELKVIPVRSLPQLVAHLRGQSEIPPFRSISPTPLTIPSHTIDFSDIKGQHSAKRALEIAAAGAHNILMNGPPGSGKTLMAKALPSILPSMTQEEIVEVTTLYSISALTMSGSAINVRPFRSPHHTSSSIALIGGGSWPKPGEVSLAHRGVLFLDEFPEFPRSVLENLRQPLEDGEVSISRAKSSVTFPAKCILVAAQNPCPCGFSGSVGDNCTCTPIQKRNYHKKISGPLLDRIDLFVDVPKVTWGDLQQSEVSESSESIRVRVAEARARQIDRYKKIGIFSNAELPSKLFPLFCRLTDTAHRALSHAMNTLGFSARGYGRILKVSRTIADLDGSDTIEDHHLSEALFFRSRSSGG